ncbi:uncharacterized protein TNCV_1261611 [Trichonephila clavipes]|nr:uncharacterized protein TNCV_1261611 [Trichonephila clavipes]
MTLHSPTKNSLAVLNHKILEANSQVQNVKLGGHQTCLSINRLWHELCDMLRRLVEPQLLDIMIVQFRNEKVSNHGSIPITIDCNVVAFIVFEEGFHQPIKRTKQYNHILIGHKPVVSYATLSRLRQIQTHEIHDGKGLDLRRWLAVALSTYRSPARRLAGRPLETPWLAEGANFEPSAVTAHSPPLGKDGTEGLRNRGLPFTLYVDNIEQIARTGIWVHSSVCFGPVMDTTSSSRHGHDIISIEQMARTGIWLHSSVCFGLVIVTTSSLNRCKNRHLDP